MKQSFTISCKKTNQTLYQGLFASFKSCVEQAVADKANLHGADFRHKNLSNANLDDALMAEADFTGANLSGTNLSESFLEECIFENSNVIDACLAYSHLSGSNFTNARLAATDITNAVLRRCVFAGLPTFSLDFMNAEDMSGSLYNHHNQPFLSMSRCPRVFTGLLNTPVIVLDTHTIIGQYCFLSASFDLPRIDATFVTKNLFTKTLT
ncbi:MAG: pentapeptide repeat-containing protein [Alphaproteobacteria bacterium]|nr:pentapeptide repeat-containing protein [Alphaproteobacteria bacterium]